MPSLLSRLAPLAALAVALSSGPARAETPCQADAARLCPGVPAEGGQLWECLVRNQFQVSSPCSEDMRRIRQRAAAFSADCAADVQRFCSRVAAGQGRMLDCLSAHLGRQELGTSCEGAVARALERAQSFVDACGGDAARLCAGVESGRGRVLSCLRSQPVKLSSRCKQMVNP